MTNEPMVAVTRQGFTHVDSWSHALKQTVAAEMCSLEDVANHCLLSLSRVKAQSGFTSVEPQSNAVPEICSLEEVGD